MHTVQLRAIDDAIMLAVPPVLLDQLQLTAGDSVCLCVDNNRLMISRPRYTLTELLDQCDSNALMSTGDQAWLDTPARDTEII